MDLKITEEMKNNPYFQKGVELFRKYHNLEPLYLKAREIIEKNGETLR